MKAAKSPLGANPERARSHNRQLVLGSIRAAGSLGRAQIARASGLSTQAVSNIIADLVEDGWLLAGGTRTAGRGLPVQQYSLNPTGGFAFGVEVRPNAVFTALIDLLGRPVQTHRDPLPHPDASPILDAVQAALSRALLATGIPHSAILGTGVVMPGPFGVTGLQGSASDLTGWQDTDPKQAFSDRLTLPVFVENDANAAAMAERIAGVAQGLGSFAYLYFGRGLGLGLVSGGQLVSGAFGNAGEIGHIPVQTPGGIASLESQVSRLSVERFLAARGHSIDDLAVLETLFADTPQVLDDWITQAAQALTQALTIIENLFDPETVILGGAMPPALLDHVIDRVDLPTRSVANRPDRAQPRLLRGTSGRMTATLGAAALVLNQTFTPAIAVAR